MRWPKWLQQMAAMLGGRAGIPSKPIERQAVFDETLSQLDNTPTPRLCQRCWNTRPSCHCTQGFAVLPIGSEEPLADEHPTMRGGRDRHPSDRPPGRQPPKLPHRPFPHPRPPTRKPPTEGGHQ